MRVRTRDILADTSFLYAVADLDDRFHEPCVNLISQAEVQSRLIVTTNFVLAECHALLMARLGRAIAYKWLASACRSGVIERVTEADEREALHILNRYDHKDFSFADATSFSVMERLGISTSLSLDAHFVQYGRFLVLPLTADTLPRS